MTMFRTALSCLCLVVSATRAASSSYDVAAMLRTESYGAVWIAPDARVAVVERRQRYDTASDYGLGSFTARQLSKLMRIDLERGGPAKPLFDQPADTGFWAEGFSPSGRYLSVMALKDRKLRAGLFNMERRELRWLDLVPDLPFSQPGPVWIDDDHLLMVAFAHQRLPRLLDGVAAPGAGRAGLEAAGRRPDSVASPPHQPRREPRGRAQRTAADRPGERGADLAHRGRDRRSRTVGRSAVRSRGHAG
ncbi:hypothetical protein ACFSTI_14425 [Rhizorhabdus histidinilytica]